jgi:hypothetical protein
MRDLLLEFVRALDAEIALIEKEGGEQSYELHSGQREDKSTGSLFVFLLSDTLRIPEDSSGRLRVNDTDVGAMVVSQEGNRIWLLLESAEALPAHIPWAKLVLNETELLRKLKAKIEELGVKGNFGLGPKAFGKQQARVANLPPPELGGRLDAPTKGILSQCLGSEVTFLWGPPGTGKTFSIAALVACLAERRETVLVTSHTHAAVEQALWALVEPPMESREQGFLYGSDLIEEGKILKVGVPKSDKIPAKVCLNKYLEEKARERNANIVILESELKRVMERLAVLAARLGVWRQLRTAQTALLTAQEQHTRAVSTRATATAARDVALARRDAAAEALERARHSFWLRGRKVKRAGEEVAVATSDLQSANAAAGTAEANVLRCAALVENTHAEVKRVLQATRGLEPELDLHSATTALAARRNELQAEIVALRATGSEDAGQLVQNAAAIFATLTKLYCDRSLIADVTWDTVIIDEASMAMVPLVAYAASRARCRLIVVGDMYQLPPVVRSRSDGDANLLRSDIYEITGITAAVNESKPLPQLARLEVQRRMHPAIAAVSRSLVPAYGRLRDAPEMASRALPSYLSGLGTSAALVTVDTSDLRPWCGKMPNTMSRFNLISGEVSVEIAALYAGGVSQPREDEPPKVGIVTPYAAQRRFLSKLVQSLGLERWVAAGTVHTFQGGECDVIIFDSVLGEPHWTARFTNPETLREVLRDLNVAVTRARYQFVFVGDKQWLKRYAKIGSGYGQLWRHLGEKAEHLDATDLVRDGFRERVAKVAGDVRGWDLSDVTGASLLTEREFYSAFGADLIAAKHRAVLFTPFIGKSRWPYVAPLIELVREHGVEVFVFHKPLSDPEWRKGDVGFGMQVFKRLEAIGVHLVPISGVHAKTIVIDSHILYDGSLNWASQVTSYELMWRFENREMAVLVERMLQLESIANAYGRGDEEVVCPSCHGKLVVVNQRERRGRGFAQPDKQPLKFGCLTHEDEPDRCPGGYLRSVSGRSPYTSPPVCARGGEMRIKYSKSGKPWSWACGHAGCRSVRWVRGDCLR